MSLLAHPRIKGASGVRTNESVPTTASTIDIVEIVFGTPYLTRKESQIQVYARTIRAKPCSKSNASLSTADLKVAMTLSKVSIGETGG